jgi:NTE family protein
VRASFARGLTREQVRLPESSLTLALMSGTVTDVQADGVFSGGGIKGLAFAGAVQVAEEKGYKEWVKLAGTSAGAVTAMALAVGYTAEALRERLEDFDFKKIADYGAPLGIGEAENLLLRRGLTHGKGLREWIVELLEKAPKPVQTFGELEGEDPLRVVGTDLAHERMVVFPEDAALYLDDNGQPYKPEEFPIADAVRISAGYPYFFPPVTLKDADTGKDGALVDGGVVSAYPVFLFDKEQPLHPTWGFRLFGGRPPEKASYQPIHGPAWPIDMLKGVLETSINALDKLEMKAYESRTIGIPTGDVSTLNFELSKQEKEFLYESGRDAAEKFFARKPNARNIFGATPPASALPK